MVEKEENENHNESITQYVGDTPGIQATMQDRNELPTSLLTNMDITKRQQIETFLERPLVLSTGLWTPAAIPRAILATVFLYEDIISSPMYANKIQGFKGLRADVVIRLQVNSNKFQAGRLLLVFIPQAQEKGVMDLGRLRSLMSITQLPRVELDLASETEVSMVIPYVSPTSYYDLQNKVGHLGKVYLIVYSPIATGASSTDVGFTLWGSLEKVQLVAPAFWISQMGRPSKRNITDEEAADRESRPLSSTLGTISAVASSLTSIPMISSIAGTASWVTSALANSAYAFGYSKPTAEQATMLTRMVGVRNMQNFDGMDPSHVIALSSTNKVDLLPGFAGTDEDEMSILSIVTRPAWYSTYQWSASNAQGVNIIVFDVGPSVFSEVVSYEVSYNSINMVPVNYIANLFEYYRGSFVVHLKIVKTTFHSGRLLVSFNPGFDTTSLTESQFLLREIIDIREKAEYTFKIPFVSNKQFLEYSENMGLFAVSVLNELVHPDTVSSSIDLLVEIAGGEDMTFAFPGAHSHVVPVSSSTWYSQMNHTAMDSRQLGTSVIPTNHMDSLRYCIGEKVSSILQLLKKLSPKGVGTITGNQFTFLPFSILMNPLAEGDYTPDLYDYLAPMYGYSRGSMRVLMTGSAFEKLGPSEFYFDKLANGPFFSALSPFNAPFNTQQFYSNPDNGNGCIHEVQCPMYSEYHTMLNIVFYNGNQVAGADFAEKRALNFRIVRTTSGTGLTQAQWEMYRGVGDDYQLGYFLGTPALYHSFVPG